MDGNQTVVFNQLPIIPNQQLVYSLPQVQGLNSNTNGQQYFLFIPATENVNSQSVVSIPISKDNESTIKSEGKSVIQVIKIIFSYLMKL